MTATNWLEQMADEFEAYAEHLYAAYPGGAKAAGFVDKETFLKSVTGPVKTGWAGYQATKIQGGMHSHVARPAQPEPTAAEIMEAAPFIRLVLEQMLELLDSEESWLKGSLESGDKMCILGAMRKSYRLLGLQPGGQATRHLEEARTRLTHAITSWFEQQARADKQRGIAAFNDNDETTFEDVRLWLKQCLDRIP